MVQVRISETYDLSTKVNKMGLIGIHTPSVRRVMDVWGNAFKAHQRFRFVSCDVTMACASMLPADPLQVGVSAGQIAPQDMFNPILYRAVSNDSYNVLQARIYGLPNVQGGFYNSSIVKGDIPEGEETTPDAFKLYYGLLADPDGWRKAMPQSGLEIKGLYPLVYQMVNNYGNVLQKATIANNRETVVDEFQAVASGTSTDLGTNDTLDEYAAYTFKGPSMRMPSLPTEILQWVNVPDMEYNQVSANVPTIPPTYVACIVTPPAKLNVLYYRMKVTWTIELTGLRSDLEGTGDFSRLTTAGTDFYGTDYVEQSSKMDVISSSVDVKDADLDLIMTAAR